MKIVPCHSSFISDSVEKSELSIYEWSLSYSPESGLLVFVSYHIQLLSSVLWVAVRDSNCTIRRTYVRGRYGVLFALVTYDECSIDKQLTLCGIAYVV